MTSCSSAVGEAIHPIRKALGQALSQLALDAIDAVAVAISNAPPMNYAVSVQFPRRFGRSFKRFGFGCHIFGVARVAGVHIRLQTLTVSGILLHELLVPSQRCVEFIRLDIVKEYAGTDRMRYGGAELPISGLEDRCRTFVKNLLIKKVVVHGQACAREEVQDPTMFGVTDQPSVVGQCGGVSHVNGYGMAMSQGRLGQKLMHRRPAMIDESRSGRFTAVLDLRVAVCNDPIQPDLMEVRGLQF
jgi:hypothetical protein